MRKLCFYLNQFLISKKANVNNSEKSNGMTPLDVAACFGHNEIAECLLKHRADANSMKNQNQTPLHFASSNGDIHMVECLLKHGADLNIKNKSGFTPLDVAKPKKVVDLLKKFKESNIKPPTKCQRLD